ncbi:MAG: transcriptional regulator, MerR family [Cyanobacteria bacterium RYN_339]|nr:transcriptional regulator, MerR family [Cyanobacteria bacterium RYN_339]
MELKIGELAGRLGINAKTVRYYEELGLLPAARRNEAGYRQYGEADEERLRFVLGAKALGLGLADIREIVAAWAEGARPCGHVARLLEQKLADLDQRIVELTRFRDDLAAYKARVDAEVVGEDVPCAHIQGVKTGAWTAALPDGPTTTRGMKPVRP